KAKPFRTSGGIAATAPGSDSVTLVCLFFFLFRFHHPLALFFGIMQRLRSPRAAVAGYVRRRSCESHFRVGRRIVSDHSPGDSDGACFSKSVLVRSQENELPVVLAGLVIDHFFYAG